MSNRSLIEINHDYSHGWNERTIGLLKELARSGPAMHPLQRDSLEGMGITYLATRHHSEPRTLPPDGLQNNP
jgi:hypothetical protein